MAEFKILKIDNSKDAAVKSGSWKNPGASFYDQLLNAIHSEGDVPVGKEALDEAIKKGTFAGWAELLKEAYLIAPVSQIKNSPHGVTPFSRSGCKYPHHVIRNGKLVVSIPGLKGAYSRACQQNAFHGELKEHLMKHFKEMEMDTYYTKEGTMMIGEEATATRRIDENFDSINTFLMERTGLNLFGQDDGLFIESVIEGSPEKPVLTSDFAEEVGEKTPEALFKWMHENIEYDNTIEGWKLRSAPQLYMDKKGNCHDQSYFASLILHSWGYNNFQLFFVEFSKDTDVGGNTHTLTYYIGDDHQYYWFENAWEDQAGIHGPYNYKEDIKNAILDAYRNDNDLNSHQYDGIVFGEHPNYRLGMTIGQYVESWHLNDDRYFNTNEDSEMYFRVEYKGHGVYDALKMAMGFERWKEEMAKGTFAWLPKPIEYSASYRSWFTRAGYKMFMNKLGDLINRYLDRKYLFVKSTKELDGAVVYRDTYQVVVDISETTKESMNWIENFVHDEVFRENADVTTMADVKKKFNTPEELLKWMDCIEYGWTDKFGDARNTDEDIDTEDMFKYYKSQSPQQLIRSKRGVCWDQTALELEWFQSKRIPCAEIYVELEDGENCPSHTFIIFQKKDNPESQEVFWFEHSWGHFKGIHPYDTLRDCIRGVVDQFVRSAGHKMDDEDCPKIILTRYTKGRKYGLSLEQYMDFAHKQFPVDMGDLQYDDIFCESVTFTEVTDIMKQEIPGNHKPYTMETLPKYMYFASRNKHTTVQNEKVFLTPYPGIASIFIIDTSKAIAEQYKKTHGKYPERLSCNTSYKEWEELESEDLCRPLKHVHVTHNIPSLTETIKGRSKGFIHVIDITKIRDQLKLFSSKDPDREVYYDGGLPLKPVKIIEHSLSWEMNYSESNMKHHGEGILERASVLPKADDLEWMNYYHEAAEDEKKEGEKKEGENSEGENTQSEAPTEETPTEAPTSEPEAASEPAPAEEGPPDLIDAPIEDQPIEEPAGDDKPTEEPKAEEPKKPESRPKKVDRKEHGKNGVRRKKLYMAFIDWAKEFNPKNTFGSIFDEDAFTVSYPFVPEAMRYFYRLANPMLCVLDGDLTFFPASELNKINKNNKDINDIFIFAATPEDLRVFNRSDRKVYKATSDDSGKITLGEALGDSFDLYLQEMVGKGDILYGKIEESVEEDE